MSKRIVRGRSYYVVRSVVRQAFYLVCVLLVFIVVGLVGLIEAIIK